MLRGIFYQLNQTDSTTYNIYKKINFVYTVQYNVQ